MKKTIFAGLFLVVATISANAQKGSVYVYGNLGLKTAKNQGIDLNINPGVGYSFNDNWSAGLNLGVNSTGDRKEGETTIEEGITGIEVGPFVRYSKAVSNIFSIYGQMNASYFGNYDRLNEDTNKGSGFGLNFAPAVYMDIKNGFGLNFGIGSIGLNSFKAKGEEKSTSGFGLDFGRGVTFGISKTFK